MLPMEKIGIINVEIEPTTKAARKKERNASERGEEEETIVGRIRELSNDSRRLNQIEDQLSNIVVPCQFRRTDEKYN